MIVPRYYEDLSVLHENTMPARAYYIPASKRMDNLVEHREESDRMQLLNGTWKFQPDRRCSMISLYFSQRNKKG